MNMTIDRSDPRPLYQQVKQHLRDRLAAGEFPAGTKLASERELIDMLGVSRITVRQAMRELVFEGLLQSFPGKGFYPAAARPPRHGFEINLIRSFTETARAHGKVPASRLLQAKSEAAPADVAALLGVAPGRRILTLSRLRLIDGAAVSISTDWLVASCVPDLFSLDWSVPDRSLYAELIGRYDLVPRSGRTEITARAATAEEAQLLNMDVGAAVLVVEQVAFDAGGALINASRSVQHPDRNPLRLEQGGERG